jgi:hypothetical protein
MGMFIVNGSANVHSQNYTGPLPSTADANGMFGAGAFFANPAFWIDVTSAEVGCVSLANSSCQIMVNGWKFNESSGASEQQAYAIIPEYGPGCVNRTGCRLGHIDIASVGFYNLTAIRFVAFLSETGPGVPQNLYIDDINVRWSNNSCAAVELRDSLFNPNMGVPILS